jgi:hypothetical protein
MVMLFFAVIACVMSLAVHFIYPFIIEGMDGRFFLNDDWYCRDPFHIAFSKLLTTKSSMDHTFEGIQNLKGLLRNSLIYHASSES